MTQFIKPQNGGGKGGGGTGDMLKSVYDPNNIAANAFDYANFINTPTIPAAQIQADWNEADNTKLDYIKNKPTIPAAQIQSDWDEADNTKVDYIKNKPNLSGYQTTANLVTDLDNADNTHYPSSLAVKNAITSSGGGDVSGPASSTDGDIVLFDGTTGKLIKDSSKSLSDYQTTISDLSDIRTGAGLGATAVQPGDLGTAASCNTGTSSGNVPILDSNGKLNTSTLPGVALTDTFTVSTASDLTGLSSAEQGDIAIVTTESKTYVLSADPYSTAANWKELLSPTDSVTSVNSKTGAVTLDADDISDSTTTNKFVTATDITTWNGKQNALTTQTAYTSKGTSTKVPTITTNTLGQVTGITETSIAFPTAPVSSVNTQTGAVILDADDISDSTTTNKFVTASEKSTWSGKQDALSTQTAYTTKGTSTKVATISTNTLGQVTAVTETSIAFPVTSVNGSTGAVTGLQTTANLKTDLTDNSDSYYPSQKAVKTAVDGKQATLVSGTNIKTVNGNDLLGSGNLTISGLPAGGTNGQIIMMVNGVATWVNPADYGFIMLDSNSPITLKKVWAGTEQQYQDLSSYDATTEYKTV